MGTLQEWKRVDWQRKPLSNHKVKGNYQKDSENKEKRDGSLDQSNRNIE